MTIVGTFMRHWMIGGITSALLIQACVCNMPGFTEPTTTATMAPQKSPSPLLAWETTTYPELLKTQPIRFNENDRGLDLLTVLKETQAHNDEIRLAHEQITETQAKDKQQRAEQKRVFFFLTYFTALDYIERVAKNDLEAAKVHLEAVQQRQLLLAAKAYTDALRAALRTQVECDQLQLLLGHYRASQYAFTRGEQTAMDVAKIQLAALEQSATIAQYRSQWLDGQAKLASLMGQPDMGPWRPIAPVASHSMPSASANEASAELFPSWFSRLQQWHWVQLSDNTPAWLATALANRPDIQELRFKRQALDALLRLRRKAFNQPEAALLASSIRQLDIRLHSAEGQAKNNIEKAFRVLSVAQAQQHTAQQALAIASRAEMQAAKTVSLGISSQQTLQEIQAGKTRAWVGLLNATMDSLLAEFQVLYESGQLTVARVEESIQP